jgi:hypothetical protein
MSDKIIFFLNTRPRGTNTWREALFFSTAKEAIEYSRHIDIELKDFLIVNSNSRVFAGNTANMAFLIKKKKMLRRFLDNGGDIKSTAYKSIKRNIDELESSLKKAEEYCVNFIIGGIKY